MTTLALLLRLLLAAVFALAAVSKLRDRAGTQAAIVDFGGPARLSPALAFVLPVAEFAVAGSLLPAPTAAPGAVAALALLVLFTGAIAISLARGRAPECHCFGQLQSGPASRSTLARNAALMIVAALAVLGSAEHRPASSVAWITRLDTAQSLALGGGIIVAVLVALGGSAFFSLLHSYGAVLNRLERLERALANAGLELEDDAAAMPEVGLEPGTEAPAFAASTVGGAVETLRGLVDPGLPLLLLFTSPRCGPCRALLPQAAAWQHEHRDVLTVAFAVDGTVDAARADAEKHGLTHVLVDDSRELHNAFQVAGTPSAVLVSANGRIASWLATGPSEIELLVGDVAADEAEPRLPLGDQIPALTIPSLEGNPVTLRDLRGRERLFVFWNPDCGFCRSMHDDLLRWERSKNGSGPELVVVSSGDPDRTREEGFSSLTLLDRDFSVGSALSANGTPTAVLIDAEGRIASKAVAGADSVLRLARALTTATPAREADPSAHPDQSA